MDLCPQVQYFADETREAIRSMCRAYSFLPTHSFEGRICPFDGTALKFRCACSKAQQFIQRRFTKDKELSPKSPFPSAFIQWERQERKKGFKSL